MIDDFRFIRSVILNPLRSSKPLRGVGFQNLNTKLIFARTSLIQSLKNRNLKFGICLEFRYLNLVLVTTRVV